MRRISIKIEFRLLAEGNFVALIRRLKAMLSTKKIDDFVRTTFSRLRHPNLHLRLLDAKNTSTELNSRLNILKGEKVKNMRDKWWQDAVIYQVYPKSFNDTTGSGYGEISILASSKNYLTSKN